MLTQIFAASELWTSNEKTENNEQVVKNVNKVLKKLLPINNPSDHLIGFIFLNKFT